MMVEIYDKEMKIVEVDGGRYAIPKSKRVKKSLVKLHEAGFVESIIYYGEDKKPVIAYSLSVEGIEFAMKKGDSP